MKTKIEFEHGRGDRVKIKGLDGCEGIVGAMMLSDYGRKYLIHYWHSGRRYEEWLYEDEIE